MKIYAVINQKGGVGKTTSVMNLGAAFAQMGKRVLLIDLDPQANLTDACNCETPFPSVYDVITKGENPIKALQVLDKGFSILPAVEKMKNAGDELAQKMGRENRLSGALNKLKADYDIAIIDCAASLDVLAHNALKAAHGVLVPVQAEYFSLSGLGKLQETIAEAREQLNPRLRITGVFMTMYKKQLTLAREVRKQVQTAFGHQSCLDSCIRVNVSLAEAPSHGKTIFEYAPHSHGAIDYAALAQELSQREGI